MQYIEHQETCMDIFVENWQFKQSVHHFILKRFSYSFIGIRIYSRFLGVCMFAI